MHLTHLTFKISPIGNIIVSQYSDFEYFARVSSEVASHSSLGCAVETNFPSGAQQMVVSTHPNAAPFNIIHEHCHVQWSPRITDDLGVHTVTLTVEDPNTGEIDKEIFTVTVVP